MEGSQLVALFYFLNNIVVNENRTPKVFAAMDDSMSNCINLA